MQRLPPALSITGTALRFVAVLIPRNATIAAGLPLAARFAAGLGEGSAADRRRSAGQPGYGESQCGQCVFHEHPPKIWG
jgi:hypothetical protein